MALTEIEQKWIEENMKEDFEVSFSEKLKFVNGVLENIPAHVPGDEAESDGYFCMRCGGTRIADVEEHAKKCMYFKERAGDDVFILFTNDAKQWLVGPFETIDIAIEIARKSVPERASLVKLLGSIIKEESYEKREAIKGFFGES